MRHNLIIILTLLIFNALDCYATSPVKILYVSKDGNDSWTGALSSHNTDRTDGPFATLEKARNIIRTMKGNGNLTSPVTVQVRGGVYYLDRTLILEGQDSGTKECPITYMVFPDEKVIISGGKRITASWQPYADKIMFCSIPEVKEGKWYFRQLFVDGKRQIRARMPDTGFYYVAEVVTGENSLSSFKYKNGDIKRWSNLNDVEILVFHSWDDSRLRIAELNEEQNIVKFTGPAIYAFDMWKSHYNGVLSRYYVENVFEGMDSPGEWYLNRQTGDLYYYPLSGENIHDSEIVAPVLNQLILCKGDSLNRRPVQYIRFSGFTLCDTDWQLPPEGHYGGWGDFVRPSAITLMYAEHCAFENNIINNVGTYAFDLDHGSADNVINRNEIAYIGSGGIRFETGLPEVRSKFSNLHTRRNVVSNNHIHHCGVIYPSAIGVALGTSGQNIVSHNNIHDVGYCGLGNFGPENIIEFNEVHHVMQQLCDGAGIFMQRTETDGTIVRNNIFHDIYPYAYYGWGIYLDERTEYVTVMNNIVYRTLSGGTMIHGGRYNFWENNVFVESGDSQIFWNTLRNYAYKNVYEKNIFYYTNPESKLIYVPGSWTFDAIEKCDYNLFFCKGSDKMLVQGIPEVSTFEHWQKKGFDFHSITADPLFVDPEHDNYTLKENSPAFKLGFQQIDVSTVGPQK